MLNFLKEKGIHDAFLLTVILKGLDGLLEIILGLVLMFTDGFSEVVLSLTQDAIIDDPDNFFAMHLRAFASQSHEAFVIGGLYLAAHGVLKVFVSVALWRNYGWAYPVALTILGFFICYEIIGITAKGSIPLMFLSVFDIAMFWLVWHEYKYSPHRS